MDNGEQMDTDFAGINGNQCAAFNRVVQKLQFLNNNRLKTAKNVDSVEKSAFFARLVQ
jgi:hypothetical protein